MTDDAGGGRVGFEIDGETLRVRDALERAALRLVLDREPEASPALPELFPLPVDRAVSFEAGSFSVPEYSSVSVRTDEGDFVARLDEPMELPRGAYCFDVNGATKALVRVVDVEVSTTGMADSGPVDVEFDRPATVSVGARSLHTAPEATITVPDDPAALAEAVSVLGSSIKEFSPERSWPTLRGHPPRIERGDALDVPSPLTRPDTGVEVIVRPDYADVYRLSTLSYYLGARMVVGDAPAIRLDTGYVESLPTEGVALEDRAEELLRTWFFLDTLARTDGYVPSDRYEYREVGPKLPFYPPNLVDLSMSERLMEYLEVDPATVAPYAPDWPAEAVLRPGPAGAELLPHLGHVMAPIRVRGAAEPDDPEAPMALATSPWLAPEGGVPSPDDDPLPAGVSVLTPAGYENRLRRETTARGEVRFVALVDSAERATAVRRAFSEPAVPEGLDEWEVLDAPDAETVAAVLSDPDVDVAYCGLPVGGGEVTASDGRVGLADLDDAPALTVFEETEEVREGMRVVENGGVGAVVSADAFAPNRLRELIGLLAAGVAVAPSVKWSSRASEGVDRIVGDPATDVALIQQLLVIDLLVRSIEGSEVTVTRSTTLSTSARVGMEVSMIGFSDRVELAGTIDSRTHHLSTAEVLDLFREPDVILRVGNDVILPSAEMTESELRDRIADSLREQQERNEAVER